MKTWNHEIITRSGPCPVSEVTLHCPVHSDQIFRPERLLAPPNSPYGYDVIAEIGTLRYLEHRQVSEIQEHFNKLGFHIPSRTITQKYHDFLIRVVAVHIESLSAIGNLLKERGGYVLHIDATGKKGTPMLLLLKDGWSGIRLLSASVVSEGAEFIAPHLRTISYNLPMPVAAVRDMGGGIETAIKEIFPGLYVITCHYHFLKDVGLKLFDSIYPRFKNRVDRRGVKKRLRALSRIHERKRSPNDEESLTAELVEHVLQFKKDGAGLAYPFSLSAVDFYRRCEETRLRVREEILSRAKRNFSSPVLSRLEDILGLLNPPPAVLGRLHAEFLALLERKKWFERVRRALRYRNGPIPLSTAATLSDKELERGRQKLDCIRQKISEFEESGPTDRQSCALRKALRKVGKLIDERRDELFAPNVTVKVGNRLVTRQVPRTNVPIEKDFRALRRHGRRIRGNSDVEHEVQQDGVGMLIALNLKNKRYVRVVYGNLDRMAERFARVSEGAIRTAKSLMGVSDK